MSSISFLQVHSWFTFICFPHAKENTFLDLVPFLLGLNAFHGPYYTSFGDGWPPFGPAHPPAGLLDLRTLLLDLALRQTTPPLDRFSKLRLDRNSSDSRGLELRYHATWQETFQYIVWFSASFPFLPSSQLLLFTPLPAFLSYAGAQLGVYLDESASLGDIHLVSISKLPPLCLLSNFLHFLHSLSFNIYTPPSLSATSGVHLVSISKLPPGAPQQLPAFMWFHKFHKWHPRGLPAISCKHLASKFWSSHTPVPLSNFLHSCGFNI